MSRRLNRYFNSSHSSATASPSVSTSALNKIFDQFRDPSDPPDTIGVNGSMRYLQALDVGLEEPTVLAVAELLKAPTMGEFSREGFIEGWKSQNADSLDKMKAKIPTLRSSLTSDEPAFKRVYLFTYNFARSANQKSLPIDVATEYWKLLFGDRFRSHLPIWIEFLETEYKKSIAKDTWNCMYDFVQLANRDPTLESYDVDGAWPSILDDFVTFYRKKNSMDTS